MTEVALKIPNDLQPFLEDSVRAGAFGTAEDFLVNLLYRVKAQSETGLTEEDETKLSVLRSEIGYGLAQAERGEFVEFTAEEIIAEGRARRAAQLTN